MRISRPRLSSATRIAARQTGDLEIASGGTRVDSNIGFASGYLRDVLGSLGLDDVQIVTADRLMADMDAALVAANAEIEALSA